MIVLETNNLGKKFSRSDDWAVLQVNMEVGKGEVYGLLGESGCGKTTILRMIAGFEKPTEGIIRLNGKTVSGNGIFIEPQNRNIGIVFQDYALFPHKTVWENIQFGLFRFSKADATEKARRIISLCGLDGLEHRYPHQLSGGQMQRVALARAMAPEPELILFDEPFSNIDSMRKYQMRDDILEIIRKTNATAIFVTHDTKDVLAIADKVMVLKKGVVLQTGAPGKVYTHPVNKYVADFFGKANIIKAKVTADGLETSIGLIKTNTGQENEGKELMLSIRPEDFEISGDKHDCFCGDVVDERFFGEFKEVTCMVPGSEGQQIRVTIYTSPQTSCADNKCYFRAKGHNLNILNDD
jgi:iron(III) transport system ATP-binding protein